MLSGCSHLPSLHPITCFLYVILLAGSGCDQRYTGHSGPLSSSCSQMKAVHSRLHLYLQWKLPSELSLTCPPAPQPQSIPATSTAKEHLRRNTSTSSPLVLLSPAALSTSLTAEEIPSCLLFRPKTLGPSQAFPFLSTQRLTKAAMPVPHLPPSQDTTATQHLCSHLHGSSCSSPWPYNLVPKRSQFIKQKQNKQQQQQQKKHTK